MIKEKNTASQIGAILKEIRKNKKLTQKDLSIEMSGNTNLSGLISKIENGFHKEVRFSKVCAILSAMDIDLLKLISSHSKNK